MTNQPEKIAIEKLKLLAEMLDEIRRSTLEVVTSSEARKKEVVLIEGWPTLARGVQFMLDQTQKFVSAGSEVHTMDARSLLMPGQEFTPTRKPYTPRQSSKKAKKESQSQSGQSRLSKTKTKRNDNGQ